MSIIFKLGFELFIILKILLLIIYLYLFIMTLLFSLYTIWGFFDADGSFEAKVYLGARKPVSFHVNILFHQKDTTAIEMVLIAVGFSPNAHISKRDHQLASGKTSQTSSKSIAFSHEAGGVLLDFWLNNPPNAPTKYLDYRISIILFKLKTKSAVKVVNEILPTLNIQNLRIASLALLYLRYQMFGKVKGNSNPKLIPIEERYTAMKATNFEIQESIVIGKQLLVQIQQDMTNHLNNLVITGNYLLGYHIGDGSFTIQTVFGDNGKSFRAAFVWNITDCMDNKRLLEAVKSFLISKGIYFCPSCYKYEDNYLQLQITNMNECLKLTDLFSQWGAYTTFNKVRLNQYVCFVEALNLYLDPNFRKDFAMCSKFIDLKWKINPGTNYKKKGSHAEDVVMLTTWFNNL